MRFSLIPLGIVLGLRPKADSVQQEFRTVEDPKGARKDPERPGKDTIPDKKDGKSNPDKKDDDTRKTEVSLSNEPEKDTKDGGRSEPEKKDDDTRKTKVSLIHHKQDPAPTTQTGVWQLHHDTLKHEKTPGYGYSYGRYLQKKSDVPLYGQNKMTIEKIGKATPAVSTSTKCIATLCCQFFLIMSVYMILKTYRDLSGSQQPSAALVAVNASKGTLMYIPMFCVLIKAVRMRAIQLSGGDPERWELPSSAIQDHMWAATAVLNIQAFIVLFSPLIGRVPEVDSDGNLVIGGASSGNMSLSNKVMLALRIVLLATLWWCMAYISVGAWLMEPPRPIWGNRSDWNDPDFPWPAPAVRVTMDMSTLFFVVYGAVAILKELNPSKYAKAIALFEVSVNTVKLAPMFCILFIGARMRALQMDPVNGSPQKYAQDAMFVCAGAMELQVLAILVVGCCLKGQVLRGNCEGDIRFKVANQNVLVALDVLRWICVIGLYAGASAVVYSVATLEHPDGADATPPVSPAMRCVMILTVLYFFIYAARFLIQTVRQFQGEQALGRSAKAFDQAAMTMTFAPMLAVLFMAIRERALLITDNKGAPQGYAQDWMYFSTWAISLQVFFVLILNIFTAQQMDVDDEGNLKAGGASGGNKICRYIMEFFRYFCLIGNYAGGIGIVYALFDLTPANANGKGSLFPWGPMPEPVAPHEGPAAAIDQATPDIVTDAAAAVVPDVVDGGNALDNAQGSAPAGSAPAAEAPEGFFF